MTIAKILVPVNGSEHDELAIEAAIQFAGPFNSHVKVLYVHPDPTRAIPVIGAPLSGEVVTAIVEGQSRTAQSAAKRAHEALSRICDRYRVPILSEPKRQASVTCSFHRAMGNFEYLVGQEAALSDLVVFGSLRWHDNTELNETFLKTLRTALRPVLLVNQTPIGNFKNVAICWDGSLHAAHAVTASLPFLVQSTSVDLLTVSRGKKCSVDTSEVLEFLALHGVKVHVETVESALPIGRALLEAAGNCGCNLIVLGGFGHSPVLETILGGVTDFIASHSKIPILMSH